MISRTAAAGFVLFESLSVIMLATADTDLGIAGWTGAGLLGAVLSWLCLRHLPEKDRQIERLVTRGDMQIQAVVDRYETTIKESRLEHQGEVKRTLAMVAEERSDFHAALDRLTKAIEDRYPPGHSA